MPIYEYSCKKCGAHLEVMQKISDAPLARHAKCGGKLEKEWSRSGFQFKGAGWYVTDYAGKKTDESKSESKEAKESKSDSKETKSDSSETKAADSKESKPKGSKSKKDAAATSGD
jgi:putative FmdB family regulatory protein